MSVKDIDTHIHRKIRTHSNLRIFDDISDGKWTLKRFYLYDLLLYIFLCYIYILIHYLKYKISS